MRLMAWPYLSAGPDFPVAIAAVNGPITARLKRDFGAFATFGTGRRERLPWGSVTAVTVAFRLPCLTAFRASLRLVSVASGLEKFLVLNAKSEVDAAIGAGEGFVLKTHWMTSSLDN